MTYRLHLLVPLGAMIPLVVYLTFALSDVSFLTSVNLVLATSIGIAGMVGAVAIYRELGKRCECPALTLGSLFLIIAFSFFVLMVIVQQAVFLALSELSTLDGADSSSALYDSLSISLNYVQLGIDVTFDVFYSLGLGLVSWVMLRVSGPTKYIGMYGILTAVFLLGFNLATFPLPPSKAGLFDIGPFSAIWWIAIIVAGAFEESKRKRLSEIET